MGLLRKAAGAGGEPADRIPGGRAERQKRGPGLLGRTLTALKNKRLEPVPAAATADAAVPSSEALEPPRAAPITQLSIELAGEDSVQISMPVRVEAPPEEPAQAAPEAPPKAQAAAVAPGKRSFDAVLEEILTAISTLRAGMELPSRMFTALTTLLGARKAAFLLYDPVRLVYAPWAVRGYDQTTLRRMRIPLGANEAWNALANGRPLILAAPALAQFQQFFSSREFSAMSRIVLVPFIADDTLIGVFLLTDLESPLTTDEELVECLARASEAGAPRVQEARAARVAAAVASGTRPEAVSAGDETSKFLDAIESSRSPLLLAALSLEEFTRGVLLSHHDLEPFRLHEDLVFFLGSFLADVGRALPVRQGRFVLALPGFDRAGLDVFSHQLSLFLHGLLGDGQAHDPTLAPRILKVSGWPAEGADLRTLVESLSAT
ncbi:MAG TPA: GAF domain-containing protein [Spirochaetia bacterium]|nr:GAF domain-containing protein [Spirochaetia bacterium]